MAVTKITYTANGSQTQFTIPFEYIAEADVDVYIDTVLQLQQNTTSTAAADHPQVVSGEITQGTALINYTFANATTIQFNSAPANGAFIFIERTTDDTSIVTFTPGSTIRAQELNNALEQVRFIAQEGTNTAQDGVIASKDNSASIDGQGKRLENLANANSDDDAVNRAQLGKVITDDLLEGEAIDLTDATGGSNSNKQVTISVEDSSKTNKGAVSINEGHAIGVTYTSGDAVIAADKSTASQQGVVKITTPSVTNGNPITLTRPADGEVELTIADGSIDVQKIKGLDKADTSEYASTWDNDDDQVATVGAIAKRLDAIVSTSQPTTAQVGKFWYNPTEGVNALYLWNGTAWKVLTSGTPYIPAGTTIVRYVDAVNGDDDVNNTGFLPQSPLRTIKRALTLINASATGDGTLVVVEPGVYQEALPLRIEKNNISIVGKGLRSCFIHPTVATENNNMWEVDSGSYIANFTMLGLKVPTADQGSRNNTLDNDATYGLPSNQPFAVSFRSGNPVILKSPYIQNCTHFSDAHFDNANFDPNTFPSTDAQTYSAVAGDESSAPCGGGLLVDGSAVSSSSPIRSMVVDAFTQITLDGPGILVTNNGYAQLVSFFGTFTHYHAKAKNGGQINLSNCVSDFGRYGLIADGKSPSAIATATANAASSGATTITIGAITTAGSFHGTVSRPLNHMMVTIDGVDYGVVSSTANGAGWDIVLTSGLTSNITNTTVSFALRSYISTGGHTFEFVGVGTDYSDHPDKGGVPVEANQVIELNGGKVWQSSTDHVGKFKAGSVLVVDQVSETVDLKDTTVTGNLAVTGTVDGRDVAADGTKLDGIEAGATADQTAAEIRTLVESATDSNVFTDADHTKLNGIAAGAEVNVNADWNATSGDAQILNKPSIPAAYGDSDVDTHLNRSTAASGEVLSWTGTDYDWVAQSAGGGGASEIDDLSDGATSSSNLLLGTGVSTSSSENTVVGQNAGANINARKNTYVGYEAGKWMTNEQNTAVGNQALGGATGSTQSPFSCTAVGDRALRVIESSGHFNTAVGADAGYSLTSGRDNTLIGNSAGAAITTGGRNVCVGMDSGDDITTGDYNVFIGNGAGEKNTTASGNTAVGHNSLSKTTTGQSNTALGYLSGVETTTGNFGTFIGSYAGYYRTTATGSTYVGYSAGYQQTTGNYNTALGRNALYGGSGADGTFNTAVGAEALEAITSGSYNVAVGGVAGEDITSGQYNVHVGYSAGNNVTAASYTTIVGYEAGKSTTTSGSFTAVGFRALKSTTTWSNVAVGLQALEDCTTGGSNTAVGYRVGEDITTGSWNTLVGMYAGTEVTTGGSNTALGSNSLYKATTASYSTAIGTWALYNCTGGSNTALGSYAAEDLTTGSNCIVIGYDAQASSVSATNEITLGNSNVTKLRLPGMQSSSADGYVLKYNHSNGYISLAASAGISNNSSQTNSLGVGSGALSSETGNNNTAFGENALDASVSGIQNTAVGSSALTSCTSGEYNVAVGMQAGYSITDSNRNTYIGAYSGYSTVNTAGGYNTAVGYGTLYNSTAGYNVAVGYNAGTALTTGDSNTLMGTGVATALTTGSSNVAVGYGAAKLQTTANGNTCVGFEAGNANVTGSSNTYVGRYAGKSCTASENTLIGNYAGYSLTTGAGSVVVGRNALLYATTGGNNVAVGVDAMEQNTTGAGNVTVGNYALQDNTTGGNNTAIGYFAGNENTTSDASTYVGSFAGWRIAGAQNTAIGYNALKGDTSAASAYYNVAIGVDAAKNITTGYDNVFIGWRAAQDVTTGNNLIVIGKSATPSSNTGSDEVTLGNSSISTLRCATQTISSLSDGRDKTEVEDLPLGLDFINSLRPVKFKWDTREGNIRDGTYDAGFIAQDLQSAQSTSDAEYLKMVMDSNPDRLEAAYGQLIPVLVQAIKDLKSEIETLKSNV